MPALYTDESSLLGSSSELKALIELRLLASELNIFSRKRSRSHLAGQQKTHFRGRGMEFEEVRLYQAGDDVRTIDWRVTARTQVPHTKIFREERERPVLIITDLRSPMFFGSQKRYKSVQANNLAAQLAWAALYNNDRVGGLVFSHLGHKDIRPKRSKQQVMALLRNLCEFSAQERAPLLQEQELSLSQILQDSRRITRPGTAVFIISDFHDFDQASQAQLHLLCRHNDVSLFKIEDPLELALPNIQQLQISNGEHRATIANNQQQQSEHADYAAVLNQTIDDCCTKLGAELIRVSTADNPIEIMNQRFGKKLKLRKTKGQSSA